MKNALLLCGAAILSGCATVPSASHVAPTNPHELLDKRLGELLRDPSSAQQYSVSELIQCNVGILGGKYCVCFTLNAKNGFGGYTGLKTSLAWFTADGSRIEGIQEASPLGPGRVCIGAAMSPRAPDLLTSK